MATEKPAPDSSRSEPGEEIDLTRGPRPSAALWAKAHLRALVSTLGELVRAPLSTLITAAVIGIALALPTALYVAVDGLWSMAERWDHSAQLTVFLEPGLGDAEARALAGEIERTRDDVVRVSVRTRGEALQELESITGLSGIRDAFAGANPLPPILVIDTAARLTDPLARPALMGLGSALRATPGVDYLQFNSRWLARLQALLALAERAIAGAAVLLGLGLTLVVGNTIGATVARRRPEIEISRLCGATDRFIRRPFLYSGLLYGLLGAALAWLIILSTGAWIGPAFEHLTALYPGELPAPTGWARSALWLAGAGALVGLGGAWLAVWRQLRLEARQLHEN